MQMRVAAKPAKDKKPGCQDHLGSDDAKAVQKVQSVYMPDALNHRFLLSPLKRLKHKQTSQSEPNSSDADCFAAK